MACEDRLVSRQHRLDRLALACAWSLSGGAVCARLLRRSGKGAPGQSAAASARRSALRADSPSVLGPVARRATRCAHCIRCARAGAPSQTTKRADARSHGPCVPRRLAGALRPARTRLCRYGGGSPQENTDIRRLSALRSTSQVTSHKSQVASRKSQSQSQSQCSAVQCSAVQWSGVEWSCSCSCSCSCCQRSARKHIVVLAVPMTAAVAVASASDVARVASASQRDPHRRGVRPSHAPVGAERQAVSGGGDFWGGEKVSTDTSRPGDGSCLANGRTASPGAACKAGAGSARVSAPRGLARRACSSGARESERSELRGATPLRASQRRRRAAPHEPLPETACRDALVLRGR